MKKICFNAILLWGVVNIVNAQVTFSEIEREEIPVSKPILYDSLQDFSPQGLFINYKQYIGLQLFMPPVENADVVDDDNDGRLYLYGNEAKIYNFTQISNDENHQYYSKYDTLISFIYKPYVSKDTEGKPLMTLGADAIKVSNRYYTIIDVLDKEQGELLEEKMYKIMKKVKGDTRTILHKDDGTIVEFNNGRKVHTDNAIYIHDSEFILVLRDDISKDTIYYAPRYINDNGMYPFILVPYFVKQKQLYDGKTFIYNYYGDVTDLANCKSIKIEAKSKWKCEVTLLNLNKECQYKYYYKYKLFYILKNDKGESLTLENLKDWSFILYDEFLMNEKRKMLTQNQIALEKQKKTEKERIEKEINRQNCIQKFGQVKGELIAAGKVAIGMNAEMCKTAWGKPWDIDKVTTANKVVEKWHYGWKKSLFFENGILTRIDE